MSKRIIICCDGTWNKPESETRVWDKKQKITNVLKTVRAIKPVGSDGKNQIVYYEKGVGTGGFFDRWIGGFTGKGIDQNIKNAYRFLCNNFVEEDEIFCFGFSRGAYTVRALGGLVNLVGIINKLELNHLPIIYKYYRTSPEKRKNHPSHLIIQQLIKNEKTAKPEIKFMGVWDTVGALGAPTPLLGWITKKLFVGFFNTAAENIKYAYQALAIDERRRPFTPSVWTDCSEKTVMQQVWFPGAHSNVGGGYEEAYLSDLAFLWMVEKAAQLGLTFEDKYLTNHSLIDGRYCGKVIDSLNILYRLLFFKRSRRLGQEFKDVTGRKNAVGEMIFEGAVKRFKENLKTYNLKNLEYGVKNLEEEKALMNLGECENLETN